MVGWWVEGEISSALTSIIPRPSTAIRLILSLSSLLHNQLILLKIVPSIAQNALQMFLTENYVQLPFPGIQT